MRRAGGLVVIALIALVTAACVPPLSTKGDTASHPVREHDEPQRLEVRLLPEQRVPLQRQRLPDVRDRHEDRLVVDRRPRRSGRSCTAAARATSTRPATRSRTRTRRSRSPPARCNTRLNNNGLLQRVRNDAAGFRTLAVSYCSHDDLRRGEHTRPEQPEHDPRRQDAPDDRHPRDEGRDPVRPEPVPDDEDVPPRRERGLGRARTTWRGRCSSRASRPRVWWPTRASSTSRGCRPAMPPASAPTATAPIEPRRSRLGSTPTSRRSRTRSTSWWRPDGSPCRSCTSGTTVTTTPAARRPSAARCATAPRVTLGYTDCLHEPLKRAIADQGPTSRSTNLPLCVDDDAVPDCYVHVVTNKNGLMNTDPSSPPDYLVTIMDWVRGASRRRLTAAAPLASDGLWQ